MFKVTIHLTQEGFSKYFFLTNTRLILTLSRLENYRSIILAVFKFISLLRSSELPPWYQRELALISQTRFRFKEKNKPETYAVWISSHMEWPVPPQLLFSGPQLVWEWDERDGSGGGLRQVRRILDTLTIDKGRAVLMASADEHKKISAGDTVWQKEPIYGTQYKVEKLDEEFIKRVNCLL